MFYPSAFLQDPFSLKERRMVTHMLKMSACKVSNPVLLVILMETDYVLIFAFGLITLRLAHEAKV